MELEGIITLINEVEKSCYLGNNDEAIEKIGKLLSALDSRLNESTDYIYALKLLSFALEKKDYILAADYLEYAIKPVLMGENIPECLQDNNIGEIPVMEDDIYYLMSCTDEPAICVKGNNGIFVRLNSCVSPEHEAEVVFSTLNIKKTTPAVCLFGIGNGLLAKKILDVISDSGKLIIYEATDLIQNYCIKCAETKDCDEAELRIGGRIKNIINDSRVSVYYAEHEDMAFVHLLSEKMDYRDLYGLVVGISNGYSLYSPKRCLDFIRNIEDFRRLTVTNKNTLIRFEEQYTEHIFRNLYVCRKMNLARQLEEILPKDIPAIVVSAGPSLRKNAELLKKAKGHFLIVAVDSAIPFLMSKDIIPDLTITIDPVKSVNCYADERTLSVPCILNLDGNYQIIEKLKGRRFILARNEYFVNLLDSLGKKILFDPMGGGSVATVIFALLCDIGIKKIILVGQDLASLDGKTHVGAENYGSLGDTLVEGIDGNMVYTRYDWYNYLKWFEIFIKNFTAKGNSFVVIDATEGGAKINGTEIMTLQAAIDSCRDDSGELPQYDFSKEVAGLDYYLDEKEYETLCKIHKKNIDKLKVLESKAEDVVKKCNELIKGIDEGTVSDSFVNKEKKAIGEIHEEYMKSPMHYLINKYLNGSVVDLVSRLSLAEGDAKEIERNGIMVLKVSFENISKVANILYENAKKYEGLL